MSSVEPTTHPSEQTASATTPDAQVSERSGASSLWLWTLFGLVLVVVVFAWAWTSGGKKVQPPQQDLPKIASVPAFKMTEASGKTVTLEDMRGTVWVADFIFTDCPGPCPKLSAIMRNVQNELKRRDVDARLVSFSLDPLNDRPEVLRHYANRFKADPSMWWFFTCDDEDVMWNLVEEGFLQTIMPGDDKHRLEHSAYLVVVDKKGVIRAAHDGLDPMRKSTEIVNNVANDVQTLVNE